MKLLLAVLLSLTVVNGKPASELEQKHGKKRLERCFPKWALPLAGVGAGALALSGGGCLVPVSILCNKLNAKRVICSLVMCDIFCPDGHAKDARGCPLCSCNNPTTTIPVHRCPLLMCDILCEGSLKVGPDGCRLCQCNDIADV